MKGYIILALLCYLFFNSCIYKAGNRQPDINHLFDINISPFYVKKYMKTIDPLYANRTVITSEIVNYSENFIPVTDSVFGYKYVIEFHNLDSISYIESHYINLASVYDFNKGVWIKDSDSISAQRIEVFKSFFKDSVLKKVVQSYQNKVPDSLLFIGKPDEIVVKSVK